MKHYISIDLKCTEEEILKNEFVSTILDTQYMNKAIVETVSSNEFKRNMHRKYIPSFLQGEDSSYSISFLFTANQSKYTGLYK